LIVDEYSFNKPAQPTDKDVPPFTDDEFKTAAVILHRIYTLHHTLHYVYVAFN
jgi:hypothetical protein